MGVDYERRKNGGHHVGLTYFGNERVFTDSGCIKLLSKVTPEKWRIW